MKGFRKVIQYESISQQSALQLIQREVCVMESIKETPELVQSGFFPRLIRYTITQTGDKRGGEGQRRWRGELLMELIEGVPLDALLSRNITKPSKKLRHKWICEIFEALRLLHKHRIVHLDLKPENVIIRAEDGRACLVDFGSAKRLQRFAPQQIKSCAWIVEGSVGGTARYMAPEVVLRNGLFPDDHAKQAISKSTLFAIKSYKFSWEPDFWSLGILSYELLDDGKQGRRSEPALFTLPNDDKQLFVEIVAGPQIDLSGINDAERSFVALLLERDPAKRRANIRSLQAHPRPLFKIDDQ